MKVTYKMFSSQNCFNEAANFASSIDKAKLISINTLVDVIFEVIVWYWE